MESVGLKEWALVCDALGRGEQAILLRKGGIAEGRDGFGWRHREFFLFPTFFHEQIDNVQCPTSNVQRPGQAIEISLYARVEDARLVTSGEAALALAPLHIVRKEVVRERFGYGERPGIYVAFVRVFQLTPRWRFPDERRFGGCRSWVTLPVSKPEFKLTPVISDAEHTQRRARYEEALRAAAQTSVSM